MITDACQYHGWPGGAYPHCMCSGFMTAGVPLFFRITSVYPSSTCRVPQAVKERFVPSLLLTYDGMAICPTIGPLPFPPSALRWI